MGEKVEYSEMLERTEEAVEHVDSVNSVLLDMERNFYTQATAPEKLVEALVIATKLKWKLRSLFEDLKNMDPPPEDDDDEEDDDS